MWKRESSPPCSNPLSGFRPEPHTIDDPRASSQQIELRALQQEIDAETKRIVLAAKNDLDQAQSNVSSLEAEGELRAGQQMLLPI